MEPNKYRFKAQSINNLREVFPLNGNTLSIVWSKEKERAYKSRELKGKLVFTGDDFTWFYSYESSQYRCEPIIFMVEKLCNGSYSTFFTGIISLNSAEWDLDGCQLTTEIQTEDKYQCYEDAKDREVNIFSYVPQRFSAKLTQGTLEYQICVGNYSPPETSDYWCGSGPVSDGWTILEFTSTTIPASETSEEITTYNVRWVREKKVSVTPLGFPWKSIGNNEYVKSPSLYNYRSSIDQGTYTYQYDVGGVIDNGMKLQDVFQGLLTLACFPMTIKSNFFGWNSEPIPNTNLLDPTKYTSNANLDTFGNIVPSSDPWDKVTDFIKVTPGSELWIQNPGTLGGNRLTNSFYDKNKVFVRIADDFPGGTLPMKIADIPANVHYVRYEDGGESPNSMLYLGTGPIPYQAYTNNNYATGKKSTVDNLLLFQKTDVKRPNVTGNATIANTTFEDILKSICNIFNLRWDITDEGVFVIEHVSFFSRTIGLNLIGRRDARFRVGSNKYTYDADNMPRRELFRMADEKFSAGDFKGLPIIYNNACVNKGEGEDRDWIADNIMTDVTLALNNPSSESQVVSEDGFVLIACDDENSIISEEPILSGNTLNNVISWAHLHRDYWRHERVFNVFTMNDVQTTALSVVPTRKQVPLRVSLCCGEAFDPEDLVITELGEGYVLEATFELYNEELSLTLLYNPEIGLTTNRAPVANNDVVETFVDQPILIDVLANDTDEDGEINPATLTVVYPGNNGVAVVQDGKILYTPNPGFTGSDIPTYTVRDNFNEISNVGQILITVKPGTALPIANNDFYETGQDTTATLSGLMSNDTGTPPLTCKPETKSTVQGGSVTIFSNGSFTYTPPSGFVGTDSFIYTLVDPSNNEDTATVTLAVFAKSTVYVRFVTDNIRNESITEDCSGIPTIVGTRRRVDHRFTFFSDPAGTVPLNVSGYGLVLRMRDTTTGSGAGVFDYNVLTSGIGVTDADRITEYNYFGCNSQQSIAYSKAYQLLTSPDYIIL